MPLSEPLHYEDLTATVRHIQEALTLTTNSHAEIDIMTRTGKAKQETNIVCLKGVANYTRSTGGAKLAKWRLQNWADI
jgi:hypothetical protein